MQRGKPATHASQGSKKYAISLIGVDEATPAIAGAVDMAGQPKQKWCKVRLTSPDGA
jgi:hypothetical protein